MSNYNTVIVTFLWVVIIFFALVWLLSGGVQKITTTANSYYNPLKGIMQSGNGTGTSTFTFKLPGQPDLSTMFNTATAYNASNQQITKQDITVQTIDTVDTSGAHPLQVYDGSYSPKTFGTPSPYARQVKLFTGMATARTAQSQYLEVDVSGGTAVNISGWSLQSAITGTRFPLLYAADPVIVGVINTVHTITIPSGGRAYIVSGISPLGVSFRENKCSGYLGTAQYFAPSLGTDCPSAASSFPDTANNLRRYGASCLSAARALPSCRFPTLTSLPSGLSSTCKTMIVNTFSYNGCVDMYRFDADFERNSWRVYLGSPNVIWNTSHDIIRLLDTEGRIVDAISY